jgi:hypothetical protein
MDQSQEIFKIIGNFFLVWAAVVGTISVFVHSRVPWRRSEFGRHLMIYMVSIALVLDLGIIRILFGDTWWFALIRLITFLAVPIAMSQRLWLQLKAQRAVKAELNNRKAE